MSQNLPYAKAPIMEALLDIRVPTEVSRSSLQTVADSLKAEYSKVSDTTESDVPPTDGGGPRFTPGGLTGRWEKQARGFRLDPNGITVSKFWPYVDWADLRAESERLWSIFQNHTQATAVSRVGLRYINIIDVPTIDGATNIADWFNTAVSIPDSYGVPASNFAFKLTFPVNSVAGWCSLMCSPVATKETETLSIFLDIHVYKKLSTPVLPSEAWDLFDKLREAKNHFFESTITDKTRGLFK